MPGFDWFPVCGVQGVGMKWVEEEESVPEAGSPGSLPPKVNLLVILEVCNTEQLLRPQIEFLSGIF